MKYGVSTIKIIKIVIFARFRKINIGLYSMAYAYTSAQTSAAL